MKVITDRGSKKLKAEIESLYDEVMTLRTAIEEAIIKGQKSMGVLNDVPAADLVSNNDLRSTCVSEGSGVVGWADDF